MATIQYLTQIEFGCGVVEQLPRALAELGIHRPLVVTDKGLEWISRLPRDLEEVEALTRRPKPVP